MAWRSWLAAALGVAVLVAVGLSSVASLAIGRIPASATLFSLPSAVCAAAATGFFLRALHDHPTVRARDLTRAIVLLLIAAFLWVSVLDAFTFMQAAGPGVAAICALACVPTTAAGLVVLRRLDRNKKGSWRLVLVATAWGAIVSTSFAFWAETLWDLSFTSNLLPGPAVVTSNAYSAGIFEEAAKGVAVLLLYLVMRDEFGGVVSGIIYGAAVGLGFNFMESIAYMTHYYALYASQGTGTSAAIGMWYGRQVIGLFLGHAAYTALIGAGIGVARQLPRVRQRVLVIACGFLAAIAAHFAWDAWQDLLLANVHDQLAYALLSQARYVFIVGPFVAVLLVLLAMGLQLEGIPLRRSLPVADGSETGVRSAMIVVLACAVRLLPASERDVFLREHTSSLADAGRMERVIHLIDLVLTMPWTAWVFRQRR
jgi:RsiW-degrading membrane proteinase PrsW (M82 family)